MLVRISAVSFNFTFNCEFSNSSYFILTGISKIEEIFLYFYYYNYNYEEIIDELF